MSSPKPPAPPNQAKSYEKQVQIDLKYAPQQAQAEYDNRLKYDPLYAQEQLQLMQQYGPQYAQYAQDIQKQIDPTGYAAREALGSAVTSDFSKGYELDPKLAAQIQQSIRGAQVARGNYLGNAPISAEATQTGDAMQQMYQQRLSNLAGFVNGTSGVAQAAQGAALGAGAVPNTSFQFINRSAGTQGQQFALQNYSNQLQAFQLQQANSPFNLAMGAIGGIAGLATGGANLYKALTPSAGSSGGGWV